MSVAGLKIYLELNVQVLKLAVCGSWKKHQWAIAYRLASIQQVGQIER